MLLNFIVVSVNLGGVLKYKSNGNTSQSKMNKNGNSSKDTAEKSKRRV